MAQAAYFVQPMRYTGNYNGGYWAGYRHKEPLGYTTGRHVGVDYNYGGGNEDLGFDIKAVANATVEFVGLDSVGGFGRIIILKHTLNKRLQDKYRTNVLYSRYYHLRSISVRAGQTVKVGQKIGECGNSGTTWAHLHCAIGKATGRGYYDYPKDNDQIINEKYYDTFRFIQANNKEAEEMDALRKENARLKAENRTLKSNNSKLKVELATTEQDMDDLVGEVNELETQNDTLTDNLSECEAALDTTRKNLDEVRISYNECEGKLAECKGKPTMPDDKDAPVQNFIASIIAWIMNKLRRK
jgi:cell division protein FtsB